MKYRKKPIEVEAVQIDSYDYDGMCDIIKWSNGEVASEEECEVGYLMAINTMEGRMLAKNRDYVIKGLQGEFYPCKPEIFEASYELVE